MSSLLSLRQKVSSAMLWNLGFLPVKAVVGVAVSIVVVKMLHVQGYATLAIVTAVLATLGLYSDFGIERSLGRFVPEVELRAGHAAVRRFVALVAGTKLTVLAVLLGGMMIFADFFVVHFQLGEDGRLYLWIVAALLLLGTLSDVSLQVLYTYFKQKLTNFIDILNALVNPVLVVVFVYVLNWGVTGVLLALVLTTVISVAVSLTLMIRATREAARTALDETLPRPEGSLGRRFVAYAGLSYLSSIALYFYDLPFVVLVLTTHGDLVGVAVVALGYKLVKQVLQMLVAPLNGIQVPLFARARAERQPEALASGYALLSKYLVLVLVPSGLGLAVLSGKILQLFYLQQDTRAVLTQASLPQVLSVTVLLTLLLFAESVISLPLNVLMVYERYRIVLASRAVALLSVPLVLTLSPAWGALGAAVAIGVPRVAARFVPLLYAGSRMHLYFPTRFFGKVLLASLIFVVVLVPLDRVLPVAYLSVVVMVGVGAGIFWAAMKLLRGFGEGERRQLAEMRVPFAPVLARLL